ncbi:lactonase family protein [Thermostaphylospora chromogena]|uniref:40-residue YVTN family beta-propeller repeat-containing protein n=1 Tax=Thermostaphylospora chromogena TaxID=35622 RepID=A0A1H1G7D2_9ACTN|nr:lactonase family protein [Thermostaphylospora chromogena]SDR08959.1 40-residue YVTN family beta-propeller repeat-containing protein [Thermostaphylospora chromogena]
MGIARLIYIGGYTEDSGGSGPGITAIRAGSGGARLPEAAVTRASGPSFLALHPRLPVLYAVGETGTGTVTAYARRPGGVLERLCERPSGGSFPCHLAVDPRGRWLVVANYGDGTLGAYRLDERGRIVDPVRLLPHSGDGPDPERQEGPHAHQAVFGPDGTLHVSDLGTDEIRRYLVDDEIVPHPEGHVRLAPGMGPRHLAHAGGEWYVAGELDGTVRRYDASWTELASVRASESAPNAPSHLEVSADGRLVYVANRGPDTVTVLSVPGLSRVAEVPCGGAWPRHFALAGDRMYVACQNSGTVTVHPLDDGVPKKATEEIRVATPACVLPVNEG